MKTAKKESDVGTRLGFFERIVSSSDGLRVAVRVENQQAERFDVEATVHNEGERAPFLVVQAGALPKDTVLYLEDWAIVQFY